jgi:hypothetical protein
MPTTPSDGIRFSVESDVVREELKWGSEQEKMVRTWQRTCSERQESHEKMAKWYKSMYYCTNIPASILPLVASAVTTTQVGTCKPNTISVITGLVTGVLVGVNTITNFAQKYQLHSEYANRFEELDINISKEMSKPRAFRIQCDVYLEKISSQLNRLMAGAPNI